MVDLSTHRYGLNFTHSYCEELFKITNSASLEIKHVKTHNDMNSKYFF